MKTGAFKSTYCCNVAFNTSGSPALRRTGVFDHGNVWRFLSVWGCNEIKKKNVWTASYLHQFVHQPSQKLTNSNSLLLWGAHCLSFPFFGQWHFCSCCNKSLPLPVPHRPCGLMMQQFITEKAGCDQLRTSMAHISSVNFDNSMTQNKWAFDTFAQSEKGSASVHDFGVCACAFPAGVILSHLPLYLLCRHCEFALSPCTPPHPQCSSLTFFPFFHASSFSLASLVFPSPSFSPFLCPFVFSFLQFFFHCPSLPPSPLSVCDHA